MSFQHCGVPQYMLRISASWSSMWAAPKCCLSRSSSHILLLQHRSFSSSSVNHVHLLQGYVFFSALQLICILLLLLLLPPPPIFLNLLPLLRFTSHTLQVFQNISSFSHQFFFTFLLSLHQPFDAEHFFLCLCCLQTLISEDLSSISPACRGLCPCPEGFLCMCCYAKNHRGKRQRQAATRQPDLRKELLGEQFISAASQWPGRDTIH